MDQERHPSNSLSEFIETSPLSLYSSSCDDLIHRRKYHGLYIQAINDERFVLLSHLQIKVVLNGNSYFFYGFESTYPDRHGTKILSVRCQQKNPYPSFIFFNEKCGDLFCLSLIFEENQERLSMTFTSLLDASQSFSLYLTPLFLFRNIHALASEHAYINKQEHKDHSQHFCIEPYEGLGKLSLHFSKPYHHSQNFSWLKQVYYPFEAKRGYPSHEDLFHFGSFLFSLNNNESLYLAVDRQENFFLSPSLSQQQFSKRQQRLLDKHDSSGLQHSAKHFLVKANGHFNILAGFPWFACWGRDSMISLPGLLLYNENFDAAASILTSYASQIKDGLIPNTLDAKGTAASYNAIDATLWFAWALHSFWEKSRDERFIYKYCWSALKDIIFHLKIGSNGHSYIDSKGLLYSGNQETQLTWMDAQTHEGPVTPRYGYAIEVNALWYHLLRFVSLIGPRFDEKLPSIEEDIKRFEDHFESLFWLDDAQYYADCFQLKNNKPAPSYDLRPNQCIALSLLHFLDPKKAQQALSKISDQLWTPYGLRTLDPKHPAYKGRYKGNQYERDKAYHNGTVWPWLLGFYTEAVCRFAPEFKDKAHDSVITLKTFAASNQGGLLPEIFDGDAPQRPVGAIHQAWSVAELFRAQALLKKY